jgi:outer membrane cobalamin receptor
MRRSFLAFLVLSIAFAARPSPAADDRPVDLPAEVVSGSVVYDAEEGKYLSPGMVTVVRPEERAGEQRTLPDLLEDVPGLRIIRLQGRNGYAVASVRGSTSSQVAVYVDGVLMNLQSEAAVDLSAIPAGDVERIEVYRGYVPSRFGAQAMGGVISVVTKSPYKPSTTLSLGTGSFGRFKGTAGHSAALFGGKFFGSFGYETYGGDFKYWNDNRTPDDDTDDYTGQRRYNGFENADAMLKWEDAHWRARASWVRRDRDLPPNAPGRDRPGRADFPPGALLDTTRWDLSLGREQDAGDVRWGLELTYTGQNKKYDSRRGNLNSLIGVIDVDKSEYETSRLGVALDASVPLGKRHFLELLAEYSDERLNVNGDMVFRRLNGVDRYDRSDRSVTLQDTISLDGAGTLLVTPSLRWHGQDDESRFTWQIAFTKEFSRQWMLKGTFGTYARAPNMYELYGDGAFILPAGDDLRWERGRQYDIGILWNGELADPWNARVSASLSGFWRETDDLIEFLMDSPQYGIYANIAEAEVKGIEAEVRVDWEKWNLAFSATWMEAKNRTPDTGSTRSLGMWLPNRPQWAGSARLTRKFERGTAFMEYRYTGANFADRSENILFDSRGVVNIGARYAFSPTATLTVGVDDLFDEAGAWRMHPTGGLNGPTRMLWYPVEGRSFYMTLDLAF